VVVVGAVAAVTAAAVVVVMVVVMVMVVVVAPAASVVVVVAAVPRRAEGAHAMACADILSAVYGYTQQRVGVGGGWWWAWTFLFLWSVLAWAADWMVQKLESFCSDLGKKERKKNQKGAERGWFICLFPGPFRLSSISLGIAGHPPWFTSIFRGTDGIYA
jgi:hypothetical protein